MSTDHAQVHKSKRDDLLTLLSDLQWHAHFRLARVGGVRYSARLLELKRLGYEIEDSELPGGDGKRYRLMSNTPGAPQLKRVKIFLEEQEVISLLAVVSDPIIRRKIQDALGSFRANKGKL